jgi:glycosyltransferase involved in cell wall biosynthesis
MLLYYSVSDHYPAYRVDLTELFGSELAHLGLEVEWFMMGSAALTAPTCGPSQAVHLPLQVPGRGPAARVLNRLLAWTSDAVLAIRAAGRRDVDAVQCRDKFFVALLAVIACRLLGKPFFYWCSYPYPEHHALEGRQRGGLRGAAQRLKAAAEFVLLYRVIMRLASHVFVQSEQMRADIAAYGVPAQRMTPVPMGVPLRLLSWAQHRHTPVVPGRVVYVGTLGAVRRLQMLIEAFALVSQRDRHATLVIVGDGDFPSERRALQSLAGRLHLAGRVTFTGFVPIEQAWTYAASAAVCVSPFYPTPVLRSTSPTKLVEYLALGRPVVCNDHPEQSAILQACGAGRCVPWSACAFADAIGDLLADPASAERQATAGPRWVARHRAYPVLADMVMARYRQVLADRK